MIDNGATLGLDSSPVLVGSTTIRGPGNVILEARVSVRDGGQGQDAVSCLPNLDGIRMSVEQSVAVMVPSVNAIELPVSGYLAGVSAGPHLLAITCSQVEAGPPGDNTFSVGVHANILVTPN